MVLFTATAQTAYADVFMVRDSRGLVYFTDAVPAGGKNYKIIKNYTLKSSGKHAEAPSSIAVGAAPAKGSDRYDRLIHQAAKRHDLDPMLVKSVIKVESDFDRFSVSSKGARGLMQLMPETARLLDVKNIFDPAQNISGGAKYLKMMIEQFEGNLRLALAAYNAGPTAVKKYGGVPPFDETMRYITKVYSTYKALTGANSPALAFSDALGYGGGVKPAVYTYTKRNGAVVFTDLPVGKRMAIGN